MRSWTSNRLDDSICPVESRVEKSAVGRGFAIGYVQSRIGEAQAPCLRFAMTVRLKRSKPTQAGEGRQLVAAVSLVYGVVFITGNSEMILVFALWRAAAASSTPY